MLVFSLYGADSFLRLAVSDTYHTCDAPPLLRCRSTSRPTAHNADQPFPSSTLAVWRILVSPTAPFSIGLNELTPLPPSAQYRMIRGTPAVDTREADEDLAEEKELAKAEQKKRR